MVFGGSEIFLRKKNDIQRIGTTKHLLNALSFLDGPWGFPSLPSLDPVILCFSTFPMNMCLGVRIHRQLCWVFVMLDINFKQPLGIKLAIEHLLWGASFRLYKVEQVTPGVGVFCWAPWAAWHFWLVMLSSSWRNVCWYPIFISIIFSPMTNLSMDPVIGSKLDWPRIFSTLLCHTFSTPTETSIPMWA